MTEPDRSGTAEDGSSSAEENPSRSEEAQQEEDQATERESREDEINEGPGKMFECDVCNMKFSNGANMRRHKMRHTGVKPYECRVCQKRFFRKDHLMEHFTTHTKSLPYHCPICNKGFQRQIAMRAHFQNEHVGHNDVVKTCPLCTFRATSMKSLRVHFYNRHGIDLDNPATPPAGPSSSGSNLRFETECGERSSESTSPLQMMPPHFLAPHVEISMAPSGSDFNTHGSFSPPADLSQRPASTNGNTVSPSASPQSSNSNTPSSSSAQQTMEPRLPPPSISLIPIKQEPRDREENSGSQTPAQAPPTTDGPSAPQESALSLIKVSPLKSLLREEPSPRRGRTPSTLAQCLEQPPRLAGCCQCIHCGIVFPDQTLYFLHKGCHSDSNPWKCNICGEQCSNIYDFNSHLLSKTHQ